MLTLDAAQALPSGCTKVRKRRRQSGAAGSGNESELSDTEPAEFDEATAEAQARAIMSGGDAARRADVPHTREASKRAAPPTTGGALARSRKPKRARLLGDTVLPVFHEHASPLRPPPEEVLQRSSPPAAALASPNDISVAAGEQRTGQASEARSPFVSTRCTRAAAGSVFHLPSPPFSELGMSLEKLRKVAAFRTGAFLSIHQLDANRMSADAIKADKRFRKYSPGEPTCGLFVKNLPRSVTEAQVRSLFGCIFESTGDADTCMAVQVLKGRMRGQAFVTFPTTSIAATALRCAHGYMMRGANHPVVIVRVVASCNLHLAVGAHTRVLSRSRSPPITARSQARQPSCRLTRH